MKNFMTGHSLIRLESVDSTNTYAARLLSQKKADEGTVILTAYQSMGKGHGGNKWISEAGCNLLFSVILCPEFLLAERQFYLSMCISNGIHEFIEPMIQHATVKWPNDILIREKKVAGILIENRICNQYLLTSVVGIGLNVNQKDFPPGLPGPVSLSLAAGREFDLTETLQGLLRSLDKHISLLYEERFAETKTYYLNHLYRMNEWAEFTDSAGIFTGRIADIADTGELIVLRQNGVQKLYGFKEIAFSG
jgi:BirA family biotin operon repressor/biotin-[acetyl-CoA-carboxylase] ligase